MNNLSRVVNIASSVVAFNRKPRTGTRFVTRTTSATAHAALFAMLLSATTGAKAASVVLGFEGISQYDVAAFGRNFIPPDTMGAVGQTRVVAVMVGYQVILQHHDSSHLVGNPVRIRSA